MLHDLTDNTIMRLLVNETRRAELSAPQLASAHRQVGAALAPIAARRAQLRSVTIEHVLGPTQGVGLEPAKAPVVVALMRAGLFVAEGLWTNLPGAALVPWSGSLDELSRIPFANRPVILVDSVINTGNTIARALEFILAADPSWVSVAALVANEQGLGRCMESWPEPDYAIARISRRSYVGRGTTDTGARLFGTTSWGD